MQFIYDGLKEEMKNSILNNAKDCNIPFCNCLFANMNIKYCDFAMVTLLGIVSIQCQNANEIMQYLH